VTGEWIWTLLVQEWKEGPAEVRAVLDGSGIVPPSTLRPAHRLSGSSVTRFIAQVHEESGSWQAWCSLLMSRSRTQNSSSLD